MISLLEYTLAISLLTVHFLGLPVLQIFPQSTFSNFANFTTKCRTYACTVTICPAHLVLKMFRNLSKSHDAINFAKFSCIAMNFLQYVLSCCFHQLLAPSRHETVNVHVLSSE
uniref:Uncharacterized protein n=1 Tax=Arundo donax TaxID=35708 RepID=A0A0A9BAR5_ARUDO